MENKIFLVLNHLHLKIFKHDMGKEMKKFLHSFSWSVLGGISASFIMLLVMILAGIKLGPDGFGNYNYILSLASVVSMVFLFGINSASIRCISDKKYKKKAKSFVSASFSIFILQAFIFSVTFILIRKLFHFNNIHLFTVLFFAYILALKTLQDSFLRSFELIKKQSLLRILESVLILFLFIFLFFYLNKVGYIYYIYSILLGSIFFICVSGFFIRGNFENFSLNEVKTLFYYGKYLFVGTLSGAILASDKFFIGKYIGIRELGVYSAYYMASFLILSNIGSVFMNVFLPSAIENKDGMENLVKKMKILFIKSFPLWITFNLIFMYFFIVIFNEKYSLNMLHGALFSVAAFLSFCYNILFGLVSIDNFKITSIYSILYAIILIGSIIIFKNIVIYLVLQIIISFISIALFNRFLILKIKKYE